MAKMLKAWGLIAALHALCGRTSQPLAYWW